MALYTAAYLASLQHGVEETDRSLPSIAAEHEIGLRTLQRMIVREGWKRRSERPPRDLPPMLAVLNEARALLAVGASDRHGDREGSDRDNDRSPLPTTPCDDVGAGLKPAATDDRFSKIDRIERLVERHLAAEEAARVQLGTLPGTRAEAERAARTLASLTQTLHLLARLRIGAAPDHGPDHDDHDDDDDMPRDIDEFRRDLARRIDAWRSSRIVARHAAGDSGDAPVEAVGE
jgi:hypothetical protein